MNLQRSWMISADIIPLRAVEKFGEPTVSRSPEIPFRAMTTSDFECLHNFDVALRMAILSPCIHLREFQTPEGFSCFKDHGFLSSSGFSPGLQSQGGFQSQKQSLHMVWLQKNDHPKFHVTEVLRSEPKMDMAILIVKMMKGRWMTARQGMPQSEPNFGLTNLWPGECRRMRSRVITVKPG